MSDELISIIAHGIADAQGDAHAEYASEFDGYAKAALDALKKHSAGLSVGGVNVWGTPADIRAVSDWHHSHATVDEMLEQAHRNASDNSLLREEVRLLKNLLFRCVIQHDNASLKTAREMFEFTPTPLDGKVPF